MSSDDQPDVDVNSAGLDDLIQMSTPEKCSPGSTDLFCRDLLAKCLQDSSSNSTVCENVIMSNNETLGVDSDNETVTDGDGGTDDGGVNYTKIIVLSVIILLTIIGNICVILAIVCRYVLVLSLIHI